MLWGGLVTKPRRVIRSLTMKQVWSNFLLASAACAFLLPAGLKAQGCGVIKADATDAVAAAPGNHKVILENDQVRVLEARVPLHSDEPAHTHTWPSVFFEDKAGPNEPPFQNVNIRWSEAGPRKLVVNRNTAGHNLLIELKNVDCQPSKNLTLPATDGVTIKDPNITVAFENEYVRVLSIRVPPGGKEPWHTHTWPAVVVYFHLPPSQRLLPDGTKIPRAELKEMQISFDANSQPVHSVENLGKVLYQAYRVELKPTTRIALR
jgi:hypothetical protein